MRNLPTNFICCAFTMSLCILGCGTSDDTAVDSDGSSSAADVLVPSGDILAPPTDTAKPDCVPTKTCADYPNQCGEALSDGCIGTLDCSGTCLPPFVCLSDATCGEAPQCEPSCDGLTCGDDGCGGSCGSCEDGTFCVEGQCASDCTPSCDSVQCGDDGCGGSCGSCNDGESCDNGLCAATCTPNCAEKDCGDDGCGGSCGACSDGSSCDNGLCAENCIPDCINKECGDDGCGDICGACEPDFLCISGACLETGDGLVVANEILYDPPADFAGDANCDGVRDASDDEFVEIVNASDVTVDLSGAILSDSVSVRHVFAEGTILGAQGVVVIFGGGTPTFDGTGPGSWCGATPQNVYVDVASTGSLGLNNGGDTITLTKADGTEIFSVAPNGEITGNDQSVVRSPELTGDWALHGQVSDASGNFSPTRQADGTLF